MSETEANAEAAKSHQVRRRVQSRTPEAFNVIAPAEGEACAF